MSERPERYLPPPTPENWPAPPIIFADGLDDTDRKWLVAHLLHESKIAGIASKRSKRGRNPNEANQHWEKSSRLFRIASALQEGQLDKRTIIKAGTQLDEFSRNSEDS